MRREWMYRICVVAVCLELGSISAAWAGTVLYVDGAAAGANDGSSWCDAFVRLQDALTAAASSGTVDEIRAARGLYRPDVGAGQTAGDRYATFTLIDGVAVKGGYAGCGAADPDARDFIAHETTLSGDLNGDDGSDFVNSGENSYHVVTYSDPNATNVLLEGFTITGGNADGTGAPPAITNQGGAVHIRNGVDKCLPGGPTLRNCVFRNNWASHHGAVNDHGLATVIENCSFFENFSEHQGGGLQVHSGSPSVTGCTFVRNTSGEEGGGAWTGHDDDPTCAAPSAPRFENCVFSENSALKGGGMFNIGNNPTLVNCTFTGPSRLGGNRAMLGAGMYSEQSVLTLTNCTFRFGLAVWMDPPAAVGATRGGGMYSLGCSAQLAGCSFVDNDVNGFVSEPPFGGGGAMYNEAGTLTLTNCAFTGNEGGRNGSGIYNSATSALLENCAFDRNRFGYGGGIANLDDSALIATACTFRENGFGNIGGAILGENLTLTNCLFEGNKGNVSGGALEVSGFISLTNCRFLRNIAGTPYVTAYPPLGRGGAIQSEGATATLTNCTFAGNFADLKGGAINAVSLFPSEENPRLINCTFVGNTAWTAAGAVRVWGTAAPRLDNCILWGNNGGAYTGESAQFGLDNGGSIEFHHSCLQGWSGVLGGIGNVGDDPLFLDADGVDGIIGTEDDDLRLASVSPLVDAGDNSVVTTAEDLNGNPRIENGTVDMGAFEYLCVPGPYGDVDQSGNVDVGDVLCLLAGFANRPDCPEGDISPCGGDGQIDVGDLVAGLDAFSGINACPDPCPS